MRKPTFIFVFLQVQVEKTHLRDQHGVYEVEMQHLGEPELTCCVPNPHTHKALFAHPSGRWGSSNTPNVPWGGKHQTYSFFIASLGHKPP